MRRMQQLACSETQSALDRSARGVSVTPKEHSLLADHLPSCLTCCAFARTIEETQKLMQARAEVLRREVDLAALAAGAHAAIRNQKRGMLRGLIGLAALIGLCLILFASTRDTAILWPAVSLLGVGAYAVAGDLARLAMTRNWAEQALQLDPAEVRVKRRSAVVKLAVSALFVVTPSLLPGSIGTAIETALGLAGLVGVFHYLYVVRTLTSEIKALRE